ncbi:flagellin [Aestuariivirga sp.]|uniref:flagellin N-terminal helical domain-containing protein n=1 Tax=Aestuariivirga sp. TaxID=2650926 RepID=UPI0039E30CF1
MTSINTNRAAMTALQSLNVTNGRLEDVQQRISTGLRVASASDNAAYWSIATTMKSDNSSLSTVQDALGLGSATVDVTYTAINTAIESTKAIKDKLVAARQSGVDKVKIQAEITARQSQLRSIADSASFSGENWLAVDSSLASYNPAKSIVSSFARGPSGITIQTINFNGDAAKLYDDNDQSGILDLEDTTTNGGVTYSVATLDISTLTDSANDTADLEQMITWVDNALGSMTTAAANLGALKNSIDNQTSFVKTLMEAVQRGVGTLVDADMTEESTKLQALQVQQQLGVQALSIANQNSQTILSLFK